MEVLKMSLAMQFVAAFCGGVFGAYVSGVVAFVFTGLIALIGIAISLAGGDGTMLNDIAFGAFFGPHVAFVGGQAAAAFKGYKARKLNDPANAFNGADVGTPLFKFDDPSLLVVGGLFGVIGYGLNYLFANQLGLAMDTIALTVALTGIACRLIFGKSGVVPKVPEGEKRYSNFTPAGIVHGLIWGLAYGGVVSYACILLGVNNIGFAVSAFSLIFTFTNIQFTSSHHIAMVAGFAAIAFNSMPLGALFGAIASITGMFIVRTTTTNHDTHIDMEGCTIAIWSFVILTLLT